MAADILSTINSQENLSINTVSVARGICVSVFHGYISCNELRNDVALTAV